VDPRRRAPKGKEKKRAKKKNAVHKGLKKCEDGQLQTKKGRVKKKTAAPGGENPGEKGAIG